MKKFLTATATATAIATAAMLTAGVAVAMQSETATPPRAPLTKAEVLARADARFTALDTNKDGQLSAEERQAGKSRRGGGRGERMLRRIDTNGDGLVSRAEHRAAAEARFARMDANGNGTIDPGEHRGKRGKLRGGRGPGSGMRALMMADTNRDGVVTRAEYDAAAAARFERLDTNRDGKLDAADRPQRRPAPAAPAGA